MLCHCLYFFIVSLDIASYFDIINYSRHILVAMLIPGYLLTSSDYIIEQ